MPLENTITQIQLPGQAEASTIGVMADSVIVNTGGNDYKTLPAYLQQDLAVETSTTFGSNDQGKAADAKAVGDTFNKLVQTDTNNKNKAWRTDSNGAPIWDTDKVTQQHIAGSNSYAILLSNSKIYNNDSDKNT